MSGNASLILAGIAGGGTGSTLASFAPEGTTLPTAATGTLNVAFRDAGWITEDGLTHAVTESSTDIRAYGSLAPVRTLTTESTVTFALAFMESNETSLAIYHRRELGDLDVVEATGALSFTTGTSTTARYAAVFDMVDGDNVMRAVCPSVQVTDRGDLSVTAGEAITYPVTLTAYPDGTGASIYWYYILNPLIVEAP